MSDNKDETKVIKLDEETVEQLVENRFAKNEPVKHSSSKATKKKKKRKKTALHILILALSFVLVFATFFIGAYIYYTSSPAENPVQTENKAEEKATAPTIPSKDDTSFYGSDEIEVTEEEPEDVTSEEENSETEEKDISVSEVEKKPVAEKKPSAETEKEKPATVQPAKKPVKEEPKEDKPVKEEPVENKQENKVVEKNEQSEAIVFE